MNPTNNVFQQIGMLLQSGRNPNAVLQSLVQSNPKARQAMQMFQGKSPQQLEQMVRNVCAERGTTVEDLARSLGISIPSNR